MIIFNKQRFGTNFQELAAPKGLRNCYRVTSNYGDEYIFCKNEYGTKEAAHKAAIEDAKSQNLRYENSVGARVTNSPCSRGDSSAKKSWWDRLRG